MTTGSDSSSELAEGNANPDLENDAKHESVLDKAWFIVFVLLLFYPLGLYLVFSRNKLKILPFFFIGLILLAIISIIILT